MTIELIARAVRGIEYVVADEIAGMAPDGVRLRPREVVFRVDSATPSLLALRTPDDVFVSVGSLDGVGHRKDVVPSLARWAGGRDWRRAVDVVSGLRTLPDRYRFDVVASLLGRRNYSRFDVEDAVGAALTGALGARYVSRRDAEGDVPAVDLTVRVFISGEVARLALRLAGTPLHRRGYKRDAERGTLHPPVGAALARFLTAGAAEVVVDPFCGDGTIPIEIATQSPDADVRGSDRDPLRVRNAAANAVRAEVAVPMTVADAGRVDLADGSVDVLATNPPWNLAVDASGLLARGLGPFWAEAERLLSAGGRMGVIMDAESGLHDELRRRGFEISLAQSVRLAGRLSQIVICTPPGRARWETAPGIREWRQQAIASGLVTDTGFEAGNERR